MKNIFSVIFLCITLYSGEVSVVVLGSGGPEIDGRASSSYVVLKDHKAIALVDAGSGSMLHFEKSGAKLEDLEAILITHLHIDHVVDLPAYIKAGYFSNRVKSLPIIAPDGNEFFPSLSKFLQLQFGKNGAYRYMSDVLSPQSDSFEIVPKDIKQDTHIDFKSFHLDAVEVHHGIVPALAFRLIVDGKRIVFSGDTNNAKHNLEKILKNADLFIVDHAIPMGANKYAKALHIDPKEIAIISQKAGVKKIVLSHRMNRTLGRETETLELMQKYYKGTIVFAEDNQQFILDSTR